MSDIEKDIKISKNKYKGNNNLNYYRFGSIIISEDKYWDLVVRGTTDIHVRALVDSGANTCVIPLTIVEKLGLHNECVPCGPIAVGLSISGPSSFITHYVNLDIMCPIFGACKWKFYILNDCSSEMVIGTDFMKYFHGSLDYVEERISFKNAPSGPGVKKTIQLRSCKMKRNYFSKPEDSDSSEDESDIVIPGKNISFTNITDNDYKVMEYYKNLNSNTEISVSAGNISNIKKEPTRVALKRPFKVRGMSLQKLSVMTNTNYSGDILVDSNDTIFNRFGVLLEDSLISMHNGRGDIWVANPYGYPVTVPPLLKFSACHVVIPSAKSDMKMSDIDVPISKSCSKDTEELTDEQFSKFHVGKQMSPSQKLHLRAILNRYKKAFAWSDSELTGITDENGNLIKAKVELNDNEPVNVRPRRISPVAKKQISEHMARELANGWIEVSQSAYGAPVLIVHKKDGTTRPVIDYREINKKCKSFTFPIPDLQDSLDSFQGCKLFCTLDCQDAFKQMWMDPDSREVLAFSTHDAKYQPVRLPFGFRNSSTIFQATLTQILSKYNVPWLVNYIDDNAFGSSDFNEMCERLETALGIMLKHNLKLKPTKCSFGYSELNFLGHLINKDGITISPDRVEEIQNWPVCQNVKDVRSFLGLVGFFRRHIWRFSSIAVPLYKLFENDSTFTWGKDQQRAFDTLKKAISTAPILVSPMEQGELEIFCDASDKAIGGVLLLHNDGKRNPIAFYSQKLKKNELNWTVTQKECYSIVRAVEKFRNYVWGKDIKVFSDHHSLQWLLSHKNPSARLARWLERLAPFNMTIYHVPGKANRVADELSRVNMRSIRLNKLSLDKVALDIEPIKMRAAKTLGTEEFDIEHNKKIFTYCNDVRKETFKKLQRSDIEISKLCTTVEKAVVDDTVVPGKYSADYAIVDGILYKANYDPDGPLWLLVIPECLRQKIFEEIHANSLSHLSFDKTYLALKRNYFWENMYRDTRRMVRSCNKCQLFNVSRAKKTGPYKPMRVPVEPFIRVSFDFVGPLIASPRGYSNVFVMVDQATRWAEMIATKDQTTQTVIRCMKSHLLNRYGHVKDVIVDNGAAFTSTEFFEFCGKHGINVITISPYHPQSNAFVERVNGTFKSMLAKCIDESQTNWDDMLGKVNFSYNTSVHSVTEFSPYYLLYGKYPSFEIDNKLPTCHETLKNESLEDRRMRLYRDRLKANENTCRSQLKEKMAQDKVSSTVVFNKGDAVMHRNFYRKPGTTAKFAVKWKGPFYIADRVGETTYMLSDSLDNNENVVMAHAHNLREYIKPDSTQNVLQEEEVDFDASWLDVHNPILLKILFLWMMTTRQSLL